MGAGTDQPPGGGPAPITLGGRPISHCVFVQAKGRAMRHLGGLHLPLFEIDLDTTDGQHDPDVPGMVRLRLMGGCSDPEVRLMYEALLAGQYVLEGGYPCCLSCTARHGPLAVQRVDDPFLPRLVWTIADKYR